MRIPTPLPHPGRISRLVLGLLAVVLLASPAPPAVAHASLVGIDPADGSTLTRATAAVTVTFDDTISTPSKVVVTGPDGQRASHGPTTVLDNTVSVAVSLRPQPQDVGRYVVAYRVLSDDGHTVAGQSSFQYRPAGIRAAAPAKAATGTPASASQVWWVMGGGLVVVLLAVFLLLPFLRRGGRPR